MPKSFAITSIVTLIALTVCPKVCGVTPETPDSLKTVTVLPDTSAAITPQPVTPAFTPPPPIQRLDSRYLEEMKERATAYLFAPLAVTPLNPGVATIVSLPNLNVAASGSTTSLPGMAGIERGNLSASALLGPLTLTAWGGAEKYGYFRGLQTIYGFGGSVSYRISPRLSLTAFGSYYTSPSSHNRPDIRLQPGIAGMMSMTTIGGYASYDLSEHWGVSVGAEATRSVFDRKWHAQPIVTPYYKINENVAIGANVGGIAYGLLQNYLDARRARHHQTPPVAPPPAGRRR